MCKVGNWSNLEGIAVVWYQPLFYFRPCVSFCLCLLTGYAKFNECLKVSVYFLVIIVDMAICLPDKTFCASWLKHTGCFMLCYRNFCAL
jgi:hypothetical protein